MANNKIKYKNLSFLSTAGNFSIAIHISNSKAGQ